MSASRTTVEDKLLKAAEVAALLNVPVTWVRAHTRTGTIPHVELGRYVRYDRRQVLALARHVPKRRRPALPQTPSGGRVVPAMRDSAALARSDCVVRCRRPVALSLPSAASARGGDG